MDCPVCGGPMWNNIGRKKNPKQPDYKCKDPQCNGVVWPPKPKNVENRAYTAPNKGIVAPVNDSYKTMIMSYCKDICVALIAKGEVKEPFKLITDGYKHLLTAYAHPFGKPKPEFPPEEVEEQSEERPF